MNRAVLLTLGSALVVLVGPLGSDTELEGTRDEDQGGHHEVYGQRLL